MSLSRKLAEPALREYMRCWADDDREGWLSLFAAEATLEDPVGAPVIKGAEAIAAFWDRIHQGDMDMRCELDRIVVCGDEALMIFCVITSGAGVEMRVQIADLFTFDDLGKITTMRAFWDQGCMSMG
jgi:steroid delta-isomerase